MSVYGLLPVISLLAGIVFTFAAGLPLSLGVAFAIIVTMLSVRKLGFPSRQLLGFGWTGVLQTKPVLFILFLAFILASVMSGLLGTSIGTLSTIGVTLIGIGVVISHLFWISASIGNERIFSFLPLK